LTTQTASTSRSAGSGEDAAKSGDVERARQLLDQGADPNEQDGSGLTALHRAVAARHHDVVALLVARGADVNLSTERGGTPLHVAAATGDEASALLLIEHGADLAARRPRDGYTPLHVAADGGSVAVIRLLLEHGADVNALDHEPVGAPPLHQAELHGHADVALMLREASAAPPSVEPIAPLLPSADRGRGEALFAETCGPCHATDPGDRRSMDGPPLGGLVGRTIGSFPRFTYSIAMEALTGRWDEETLNAFIAHPMATVPGTRMNIDGLGATNERADLIAYLRLLEGEPSP
jgi:cytochrome c2